jgi:hypothetical protein
MNNLEKRVQEFLNLMTEVGLGTQQTMQTIINTWSKEDLYLALFGVEL